MGARKSGTHRHPPDELADHEADEGGECQFDEQSAEVVAPSLLEPYDFAFRVAPAWPNFRARSLKPTTPIASHLDVVSVSIDLWQMFGSTEKMGVRNSWFVKAYHCIGPVRGIGAWEEFEHGGSIPLCYLPSFLRREDLLYRGLIHADGRLNAMFVPPPSDPQNPLKVHGVVSFWYRNGWWATARSIRSVVSYPIGTRFLRTNHIENT